MLLTTGHTSQGCGWWVATLTTPVGARPVKSIFMGYLFGFQELCGLGLGILFTLERMFGDRATKQPKYCHFICPFVVPSNIVLVATTLHGYCSMSAPLTACLVK